MKIFANLIIAVVALLSIAAGLAKLMQTPQEMEFLQGLGLTPVLIIVFGLVQVAGGVLLVPQKTRMVGAVLATSALVISTVLIFISGKLAFGMFSTVPMVLGGAIIYQSAKTTHNKSSNQEASKAGTNR